MAAGTVAASVEVGRMEAMVEMAARGVAATRGMAEGLVALAATVKLVAEMARGGA